MHTLIRLVVNIFNCFIKTINTSHVNVNEAPLRGVFMTKALCMGLVLLTFVVELRMYMMFAQTFLLCCIFTFLTSC